MINRLVAALVCVAAFSAPASAQNPYNLTSPVRNLATMFSDLYGRQGLIVDSLATLPGEQQHSAHFNSDFQSDFGQFTTALVSQLVSVPLPSPASGFTYNFDPSLGVFQRTTQSFGPILAERADTIGRGRLSFGFALQRFSFDTLEGLDLRRVPVVFTHDRAELRGGREDVVSTLNSIEATVSQFTTFISAGVTDRLDVSVAVPIVSNNIKVVSEATVKRLGTINPLTHYYIQADGEVGVQRVFTAIGSASGLGDVTVRLKSTLARGERSGLAAGLDVRLPTGEELDLLGSGATGVQPFAIWSGAFGAVSPHLNVSYKWNGSSVLAGNPSTGETAGFPDLIAYAAGADVAVNARFTFAFGLLGRYVFDSERVRQSQFQALDGVSVFPNIVFTRESFNALSGTLGMKANVFERLLFVGNLVFKLDEHGLRDKITPLVGLEYAF